MPAPSARILVADDQPDVAEALRFLLKPEGYAVETFRSPSGAAKAVESGSFDLAIIDLNYTRDTTGGAEGLALLQSLKAEDPTLPVVVMTAWATVDLAVQAMQQGAKDFITKPWDNARVLATVRTQLELSSLSRHYRRALEENRMLRNARGEPLLIAESAAMKPVLDMIARVGPSDATVLITGENGTGKGLVAQALHAASARANGPLISVNMGGIPEQLFESELFGHVRGAFTDAKADRIGRFELADGGTLFLDEVGNLPLSQQAKLLRTLERGEFERVGSSRMQKTNVRLVAATNAPLAEDVAAGKFRQDLFFRLNTIQLHVPPLRERPEDIPLLAEHFLRQQAARYKRGPISLSPEAIAALRTHPWPGNVRELAHAIERAVLMCRGDRIAPTDLGLTAGAGSGPNLDDMSIEEVEAYLIRRTLARCGGSAKDAAEALGLSRSAFYRRLEKHGL
ncbi:sigma-54-dependent transcriptional regulator [Nibricoccus sp. IMCC34717]|uniref:sigma-54-dependent transcriptional regulator n=1 Tax=Nibricoccus sp. IMCC34717 TaxID=3034021 RepID=UPI0038508CAB